MGTDGGADCYARSVPGAPGVGGLGPEGTLRRWWARRRIVAVFERPAAAEVRALPIRRTGRGIWVATPIRVIEEAAGVLSAAGLLGGEAPTRAARTATVGSGAVAAASAAQRRAKDRMESEMRQAAGGLPLPGLGNILGGP
jgi:hypothetical protein